MEMIEGDLASFLNQRNITGQLIMVKPDDKCFETGSFGAGQLDNGKSVMIKRDLIKQEKQTKKVVYVAYKH
jgi:hypothetical protein